MVHGALVSGPIWCGMSQWETAEECFVMPDRFPRARTVQYTRGFPWLVLVPVQRIHAFAWTGGAKEEIAVQTLPRRIKKYNKKYGVREKSTSVILRRRVRSGSWRGRR